MKRNETFGKKIKMESLKRKENFKIKEK